MSSQGVVTRAHPFSTRENGRSTPPRILPAGDPPGWEARVVPAGATLNTPGAERLPGGSTAISVGSGDGSAETGGEGVSVGVDSAAGLGEADGPGSAAVQATRANTSTTGSNRGTGFNG